MTPKQLSLGLMLQLGLLASLQAQSRQENELLGSVKTVKNTVYYSTLRQDSIRLLGVSSQSQESYERDGRLLQLDYQINTRSLGQGPKRRIIYTYDAKKRLIQESHFKNEQPVLVVQKTYQKDLLQEVRVIDQEQPDSGKLMFVEHYAYKAKGREQYYTKLNDKGDTLEFRQEIYDKQKRLIALTKRQGQGSTSQIRYAYPQAFQERKEVLDAQGRVLSYTLEKQDAKGRMLEKLEYEAGDKLQTRNLRTYDQWGNLTSRQTFSGSGEEQVYNYMRYEYKYDKHNNWIECVEFLRNGNTLDLTKREIEYFD